MSDYVLLRQFVSEANELYERALKLEELCEELRRDVKNLKEERDSWRAVSMKQGDEIDELTAELNKSNNG